jgi:hypothetical protein
MKPLFRGEGRLFGAVKGLNGAQRSGPLRPQTGTSQSISALRAAEPAPKGVPDKGSLAKGSSETT